MDREAASGWLAQRYHRDLDPRAERALRAAGLAWHVEEEAERQLALAAELSPGHRAVQLAHYRYYLYKHRFAEALASLQRCLTSFADALGWDDAAQPPFACAECELGEAPELRAWMFARQALGYLLLRLGRTAEGVAVLQQLTTFDVHDQTKTRVLLSVVTRPADDGA
jgi:tetratricopeptide (TPR) repeat protein